MDVLVLQHIACEPPGAFEDVLLAAGADIHRVELDEGDPLPPWQDYVAIVAMGGPMSVNDDAELPWLTLEKQAIADAVRAGVPYWGSCLGVQLLAASLGARVYPGTQPEVGVLPGHAHRGRPGRPGLRRIPPEFLTLQWHGDTFDLPEAPRSSHPRPPIRTRRSGSARPRMACSSTSR